MRWWKLTLMTAGAALVAVLGACGDDSTFEPPPPPPAVDAGPDDGIDVVRELCDPDFTGPEDGCVSDNDCDNNCFCDGLERCEAGSCVPAAADPCADEVECTEDVCFEELDRCFRQPQNDLCSDGQACNGFEICNPETGCEPGVSLFCNDENSCTVDTCNNDVGCVFTRRDLDGDGFLDGRCGGEDCNDDPREGIEIFPGAPENCTNRLDDNCDGIRDFNQDTCVPQNNLCEDARILPGPGLYSASTKLLTGDYAVSCGGAGVDAVFQFNVPSGFFPEAEIDAVDLQFQALGVASGSVALRNLEDCAGDPETDLRCNDGGSPSFLARSLAPGDYVVIVTTSAPITSFDVRLEFLPPTPVPNYDICNAETDVITESGTYTGRFEETAHNYEPSCGFAGFDGDRRDGAYRLVLTEPKDVTLELATEAPTTLNQAVLAVYQNSCDDSANEGVCRTATTAIWSRRGLPAGEYFIVIEARSLDAVSWELEVEIEDPEPRLTGDACETAIDISDGTPRTVILEDFEEDLRPSCDTFFSSPPRDAVFTFTLTDTSDVTITSTVADDPAERFPNTTHSLAIVNPWEGCGLFATEQSCSLTSSPQRVNRRSLAAGTYYVVVTSDDNSQLSATVSVDIGPPTPIPENDRCDGVIPEVCDEPVVIDSSGTWSGFNDDYRGTCVSTFITSLDAVFRCTLDERSFVNVSANRIGARTFGTVYTWIGSGATCPGATSSALCRSGGGSPASASVSGTLDAGTYWIVTESRDTDAGDYRLVVVNTPDP